MVTAGEASGKTHPKNNKQGYIDKKLSGHKKYLKKCGADGEYKLVSLEKCSTGRDDHICKEGAMTKLLCIGKEN